jgi:mTERF domain-containing protein, mitochondrial
MAAILKFLVSKGLRREDAALNTPFAMSEKLFLDKFVKCFKEDSTHLLKLYQEKLNLANSMEKKPSWCV